MVAFSRIKSRCSKKNHNFPTIIAFPSACIGFSSAEITAQTSLMMMMMMKAVSSVFHCWHDSEQAELPSFLGAGAQSHIYVGFLINN